MKLTKKRALLVFLLLFVCWLALYVARPLYLPFLGEFLISADPLEKADAIIVLAGDDAAGSRVAKAVSLVREGWSQVLMVSDAPIALNECLKGVSRLLYPRFDVLVVDSAPTDPRTREVADGWGA
jgi:hypothetical protein